MLITDSLIICGDFNEHHTAWGSAISNKHGCTLQNDDQGLGLAITMSSAPSFLRPPQYTSAIDVTFHSLDLIPSWWTYSDTQGSDHFPIYISLLNGPHTSTRQYSLVNWDRFHAVLAHSMGDPEFAIKQASTLAMKTGRVSNSFPTPDWQVHKVIAVRKHAQ